MFPGEKIPEIINFYHKQWNSNSTQEEACLLGNIVHLADRIAVLIRDEIDILISEVLLLPLIPREYPVW